VNRRSFLTAATCALPAFALAESNGPVRHLATNTYPWGTFAKRDGSTFPLHTSESLSQIAATGLQGYEPILRAPEECEGLGERLRQHGLEMRSFYVNSTLHDADQVEDSIRTVLAIAEVTAPLGAKILVTNPSPIRWGGTEDKNDAQLQVQAAALDSLGAELKSLGLTLAYHNHDSELRQGAREFHHMLTATNPELVKFCLDSHWVFRGCGNSQVALFDALAHYADRIVELHLRQSAHGIWTETFTAKGDIDYQRLFEELDNRGIHPHLVLEQAVENGSPHELDAVAAHRLSRKNLSQLASS